MKFPYHPFRPSSVHSISLLLLLSLATAVFGQQSSPLLSALQVVQPTDSLFAPSLNSLTLRQPQTALATLAIDQTPEKQVKTDPSKTDAAKANEEVPVSRRQPKRILGIMPNYRAVSAGAIPPPPTPRQAFKVATQNSFDYSAFVFVGFTSGIADAQGAHKALGHGVPGYWGYYWRGFLDKTDGNYLVIFAMPTIFHQDERYFAMGKGNIGKRALYAASRVLITPNYHGHNSFNASELVGRSLAQGISASYYPSADRSIGDLATRLGYSMMRDAFTNTFREFWPDIATHVLHRHP